MLALILGVMVWLAATQSAEPMRERMLGSEDGGELPIVVDGLGEDLTAFDLNPSSAVVRLRGTSDELAPLTSSDVRVTVDLSEAPPDGSVYTAPLRAECVGCGREAVRIAGVSPETVSIRVEPTETRRVPVVLRQPENGAEGCRGVEAQFDPPLVGVSGARSRVAEVDHVAVDEPADAAASPRLELSSVPVVPSSASGEPVAGVSAEPDVVAAEINFVQLESCAQVAVLPVYSDPPAGYYVAGIEVEPDHIQLRGDPTRLAAFQDEAVVLTQLIDISNNRSRLEALTQLDLPSDVETVGAADGVTVTILVSPFPGTRLIELPIDATGVGDGVEVAGLSPSRVQVLLSGPLPELDSLDVSTLKGTVDVTGLPAGTHRLRPAINLPSGLRVRSVAPAEVDVRIVPAGAGQG